MKQKQIRKTKKINKIKIKNKNVVNIHFHKSKKTKTPTQQLTTSKHRQIDTYQPRLPIYHPFVNAPVPPTPLQNPVNVYVNGDLTKNKPDASALAAHVHATPSPPAPSTPVGSSTPVVPPKQKVTRAKKGTGKIEYDKTGNQPEKHPFPKFEDLIDNGTLDEQHTNTLKDMVSHYDVDIRGYAGMKKGKLLSAIKKKYKVKD